jgi:hypothetical protein
MYTIFNINSLDFTIKYKVLLKSYLQDLEISQTHMHNFLDSVLKLCRRITSTCIPPTPLELPSHFHFRIPSSK